MLLSRNTRKQLQRASFAGAILLILALGSARLLARPTPAGAAGRGAVVISEFVAAGQTALADEDGEYHDWIELHNRSSRSINLLGWSLTDDPATPNKWMLPNIDLPAGEFLLLYASGKDRPSFTNNPKEAPPQRLTLPAFIHINFKLAAEGGYLALHDNTSRRFLDAASFDYPRQFEGMSYGFCEATDSACYLATPTPGQPNDETVTWQGLVAPVTASVAHGFYDAPFEVTLASETPDAAIWYTTDGSEPEEARSQAYTGPLPISGTTVLRATAVKPGHLSEPPATFSYIFPEQVLHQPENPPGYPPTWGAYGEVLVGFTTGAPVPADYGMDPQVVEDPTYWEPSLWDREPSLWDRNRVQDSLLSLPSLSLVTGVENLDIYFVDPLSEGPASERPVSVEWIDPSGVTPGFQVDAGLRIQGHLGRGTVVPKHSFRLLFKDAYGPAQLAYEVFPGSPVTRFDTLVLRAGNNESYAGHPGSRSRSATYARDEWLRRSQLAVSGYGVRGRFVHLYLNGLYWGVYNLVERPNAAFAASYFGGEKEEWRSADPGGADDGILDRLAAMRLLAELGGLADPARYAAMLEFIDPVQFSDYVLIHWYAGMSDWPHNNWSIAMREPGSPFHFFAWDGELSWEDGAKVHLGVDSKYDRVFPNIVKPVFSALVLNPDFRMTLADRLYKHTSPGGALSDAASQARWLAITGELEEAILAESARWGDALFEDPITPDDWRQGRDDVLNQMNGNAARLVAQAQDLDYYPPLDPPAFSQEGATFEEGLRLTMSAGQGDIYYTLDGSDPRVQVTAAVNPTALLYAGPVELTRSTRVRARAVENGVWSALHEADFVAANRPGSLRITELMYNPTGGNDYEFLELTNVGDLEVDLSGAAFEGIDLRFTYPLRLAPGATLVLAADARAFQERYGNAPVAAIYRGELANRGETIKLRSADGELLLSLTYDDENGWPLTADGKGDSLVLVDLAGDFNDPRAWGASSVLNGTPGVEEDGLRTGMPTAGASATSAAPPPDVATAQPANTGGVRFGDDLLLAGYDAYLNGRPLAVDGLPVLGSGDVLEYVLYWRSDPLVGKDVRGFVQLLTPDRTMVSQDDRPAGLLLRPVTDRAVPELIPDRYTIRIPAAATVGLVRPIVGAYLPDSGARLPVFSAAGARLGDDYELPPLKIAAGSPAGSPRHPLHARFGGQIELLGYTLVPADPVLQPSQVLTITLFFRAQTPLDVDLTRSVQLYDPENGMAAQIDSQPAGGRNPTWSWKAGEIVADEVVLTLSPEAAPGLYTLLLGFYELANGIRVPVVDETGHAAPDQILRLHDINIIAEITPYEDSGSP